MQYNKKTLGLSILAADLANLERDCQQAQAVFAEHAALANLRWHIDIMDGHYVPNLSFGLPVLRALAAALRQSTSAISSYDVHFMVEKLEARIRELAELKLRPGVELNSIIIHPDSSRHLHRSLQELRREFPGVKLGLAFNPSEVWSAEQFSCVADYVDLILIMAVNPGYAGQKFIPHSLQKLQTWQNLLLALGCRDRIELAIDGGVKVHNYAQCLNSGADHCVLGTGWFDLGKAEQGNFLVDFLNLNNQ